MPADAELPSHRRRRRIAERCWRVYSWISRHFQVAPESHEEFLEAAELALWSGALQLQVRVAVPAGYGLDLREEYDFRDQELVVAHYSYVLIGEGQPLLRADPLPHHRLDYRGRRLTHFPHHLHDEQGRVRSFSGELEDFLSQAAALLRAQGQS
jgi:hypothetical protein